ncbi:MAG: thiolase family protein [Myxococcota bacterium]
MAAKKKARGKKAPAKRAATTKRPAAKKKSTAKKPAGKKKAARGGAKAAPARKAAPSTTGGGAREVVILSAVRTGLAKGGKGTLKDTRPDHYAAAVIQEAIKRAGLTEKDPSDLVLGCAMPEAEQGMNVARISGLLAGLPVDVPAMTLNRFCSSGLEAVATVSDRILANRYKVGVAGGLESMSLVPMGGHRPSASPELMDRMPEAYTPMGITAENVAKRFHVSRQDQDEFALRSHQRAVAAIESGRFRDEILPVTARLVDDNGQETTVTFDTDEGPRKETTLEALSKLKPAFDKEGSVTAGNSSQVTDGAAAVVVADAAWAKEQGLKPRAYLRGYTVVGVPPDIMGVGPVYAIRKLLDMTGLKIDDIDLFEINEAFASQAIYCQRELGIDTDKLNVNGGAIALGHPLGCTGARQIATILSEMERRNARYGVISMCVGGGMGAAGLLERAV